MLLIRFVAFFLLCVCSGVLMPGMAVAATASWQAPDALKALLDEHLPLAEPWSDDETEQAIRLRQLRHELNPLLASQGYFSPQLQVQQVQGNLLLQVKPGPRAMVAQVHLVFNGDLAVAAAEQQQRVQQLRQDWSLQPGMPFVSADWEQAKDSLLLQLLRHHYAAARIDYSQANVNPLTRQVILTLVVNSGPAFKFGELQLSGLRGYSSEWVDRFVEFKAGEAYRRDKLFVFQAQLQSMPQFRSVRVYVQPQLREDISYHELTEAPAVEVLPVYVEIEEMKPRQASIGLGYSTNNGVRSELGYGDHRFLGRPWNLKSELRLEQNRQQFFANIDTLPNNKDYILSWGANAEATSVESLETAQYKLSIARSRTLNKIERRVGIHWQQENIWPQGGNKQRNQALVLDWQWRQLAVNDSFNPASGYVMEFRLGGGLESMLSDQDFLRSYARYQFWWPLSERDIVSARTEAGFTQAATRVGIPQEYLFRVGGTQSVRGYAYQSLGERDGDAVVGARSMGVVSVEYTHWLENGWGGAVFVDAGDAADSWAQLSWRHGYGLGVRWRSPVGPLALDVAKGDPDNSAHLHFAIAVAF